MPDRIRYSRWPQALTWAFLAALFLCGWWLEERFLQPPGSQQSLEQLPTEEYDVQRVVDGDNNFSIQPGDEKSASGSPAPRHKLPNGEFGVRHSTLKSAKSIEGGEGR